MMNGQSIQVMIVDDHTMVRKGLKILLEEVEGIDVIGEAPNGMKALELVEPLNPDVILMDLSMPGMDGIDVIRNIIAIRPDQRIIVLTAHLEDERFIQAIQAGAQGCLGKNIYPEELIQSIQNVHAGRPSLDPKIAWEMLRRMCDVGESHQSKDVLSDREIEVLRLLTQGKRDPEIAEELFLSEVTIRTHINRILSKLHLKNRVQAALYGLRSGLVPLSEVNVMTDI